MLNVEYWLADSLRMWMMMKLFLPWLRIIGATALSAFANFEC